MINMDCSLQSIVFVSHLILFEDVANAEGYFPSGYKLGGSLRRGSEHIDQTALVVWVRGGRGWRSSHLLVGELKSLLYGLDVTWSIFGSRRWAGIRGEVWGKSWFATCRDH